MVYAQPVSINPVGRPIPSIPIKSPIRGTYGPPKPVPLIPGPPNRYGPPHKFGPPPPNRPYIPPRRGYGPPPAPKPYLDKNYISSSSSSSSFLGQSFDSNSQFLSSKPPSDFPYEIDAGLPPFGKDKKPIELVLNGEGASAASGGVQQHVHHHFHHGSNTNKVPVAGIVPLVSETVGASLVGNQNLDFKPSQLISSGVESFNSGSGFSLSSSNAGLSSLHTTPSLTIGGSSLSGNYGGQSIANYGGLGSFASTKPTLGNYGPQTFGSSGSSASSLYNTNTVGASVGYYGSSDFYKKELDVGSLSSNSLINGGDKYQGLGSSYRENYDCLCVPYDQCPSHEIIGRKDDLILHLDPRNLKSDIEAEEERVITDSNGNMTTVRVPKNASLNATAIEDSSSSRTKRDATDDKKSTDNSQAEGVNICLFIY